MRYQVIHETKYEYQAPAALCHNIICQGPGVHPDQDILGFDYQITPEPSFQAKRQDFFENQCIYFSIQKSHQQLQVIVKSEVQIKTPSWQSLSPAGTPPWEEVAAWLRTTAAMNDIRQFYLESDYVKVIPGIKSYALASFTPGRPVMEAMLDLNSRIYQDFEFTPGFTDISTPLENVFAHKKGVCQDFAHFSLVCLRSLGLAARYVSGYIETLPPPPASQSW